MNTNVPFEKRIWGLGFQGSLVTMQESDLQLNTIYKGKEASGFNPTFHNRCTVKHSSRGYKYHNRKSQKGQEIRPFPSLLNMSFYNRKIIKSVNNAISICINNYKNNAIITVKVQILKLFTYLLHGAESFLRS
jgi:hypothetical protein